MHISGIKEAKIYYRTDTTQPYLSVPMTLTNANNHTWTGYIPVQPSNTTVYYYIQAKANSGKVQVRPLPAPASYWKFKVYNPTGTKELTNDNISFKAYYINQQLVLDIYTSIEMNAQITLHNNIGQKILNIYNGNLLQGNQEIRYNCNLAKGMYIVNFSTSKGSKSIKLIVY